MAFFPGLPAPLTIPRLNNRQGSLLTIFAVENRHTLQWGRMLYSIIFSSGYRTLQIGHVGNQLENHRPPVWLSKKRSVRKLVIYCSARWKSACRWFDSGSEHWSPTGGWWHWLTARHADSA